MANRARGEVSFRAGKISYKVRFGINAICELEEALDLGINEIGERLADLVESTGRAPDFIAIDGGEGGTGAAPLAYTDHVSLPFKIGFARVYPIFQEQGISQDIVWLGSGKLGFPDRAVVAFAMGCDAIQNARESMMAIGCIQAQKCHTDHCPAGVAT